MNKERLETKICELLNITEDDKSFAFDLFKEKLAAYLNIGEAVKIDGLGVFQLKEQLSQLEFDKNKDSSGRLTLLFSPGSDQTTKDSLFLHLDIQSKVKDGTEFNENVFQLGIGKPLIPIDDDVSAMGNEGVSNSDTLANKVNELIIKSEKLESFDLWDDYLKNKEVSSMLEEELEITDDLDSVTSDLDMTATDDPLYNNDVIDLDENEIIEDLVDENNFMQDNEIDTLSEDISFDEEISESVLDEDTNNMIENLALEAEEINDDKDEELGEIKSTLEDETPSLTITDEIDLETTENIMDDEVTEQIDTSKDDLMFDKNNINDNAKNIDKTLGDLKSSKEIKYRITQKRRNPIIYMLIAAFIIVGSIGIYYLFFQNPTWMYDEHEMEVMLSQAHSEQPEEDIRATGSDSSETDLSELGEKENLTIEKDLEEDTSGKNKITTLPESIPDVNIVIKNTDIQKQSQNKTRNSKDTEVSKNIYSDDNGYSIQVSSWKQNKIAQQEVNKLQKKGYLAFIVKVYIEKFQGTWYRVKVGPFNTLKEAKTAQLKIN